MTKTPIITNIHRLIILSIFFLVGCSKPTLPGPTLSSPTNISTSPTQTPGAPTAKPNTPVPDTLTPSPVPTLTTTSTPSPTPLATLSPEAAQHEIARLMETNNNCSGVCFWGITPEVSNFEDVVRSLKTLNSKGLEGVKNSSRYYNSLFPYKDNQLTVGLAFTETNGIIQYINAGLGGIQAPNIIEKDWLAFRPDNILKSYGVPKQVIIAMGGDEGGHVGYEMDLLYDRMAIKYDGSQVLHPAQRILYACPIVDHNIQQFDMKLGKYDDPSWLVGIDITRMSTLTPDSIYKILTGDPKKACFNLDYDKFLSPK